MSKNNITQETAMSADGLTQLGEARKGLPNIEGLVQAYLNQVQKIENALWDVITSRYLATATAAQLDSLGALVDEQRLGRSDTDYRQAIGVQIRVLRTHGRDLDIIAVAILMGYTFDYSEIYPAGWELDQYGITTFATWAADKFKHTKAAGTSGAYVYSPETKAKSFIFGSVSGGVTIGTDGDGFGSSYGGTVHGGDLGGVINV